MSRSPVQAWWCAALAVALLLGGCNGCGNPTGPGAPDGGAVEDAGGEPELDGGRPPPDAGPPVGKPDGGPVIPPPPFIAGEACPPDAFSAEPDAGVRFDLCIALQTQSGLATHNGAPLKAPFALRWVASSGYESEYAGSADAMGRYDVRVLRSRYEQVLYQPTEIFPTHQGEADLGVVDLTADRMKDLPVKSAQVSGTALFGGLPWKSLAQPLDTTIIAGGLPSQASAVQSDAGTYAVRLMQGVFELAVAVPRESLGDTSLRGYPVAGLSTLSADTVVDIALMPRELSGTLTLDGKPFPDRVKGAHDYSLGYTVATVPTPVVTTYHEGGVAQFKALLPENRYDVTLEFEDRADAVYPSSVTNLRVASGLNLATTSQLNIALDTWTLEGAVAVDGVAVPVSANTKLNFYAYAYQGAFNGDWFVSYYEIPNTTATFEFRAFPATYYLALYLESALHPELAEGWYVVDRELTVDKDLTVPIDIQTTMLEGTLHIDGVPANASVFSGTLTFVPTAQSLQQGTYRYRVRTSDGSFRMRLPRARYEVYFEINPQAYPEHASGRQRVQVGLDGMGDTTSLAVRYVTRRVVGPLRVGGAALPDSRGVLPEARLELSRDIDHVVFRKALEGGRGDYSLRIPAGDYVPTFVLEKDALPKTAWGAAPVGGPRLGVR